MRRGDAGRYVSLLHEPSTCVRGEERLEEAPVTLAPDEACSRGRWGV